MNDLISRQKALEAIDKYFDDLPIQGYYDMVQIITNLPPIEPKHGTWIYPTDIDGFGRCENCKALWDVSLIRNKFFKHCPRCGHPMERGAEILKMANEQV